MLLGLLKGDGRVRVDAKQVGGGQVAYGEGEAVLPRKGTSGVSLPATAKLGWVRRLEAERTGPGRSRLDEPRRITHARIFFAHTL